MDIKTHFSHASLFTDVWEYLDFKRHGKEALRTSPDGLITACLKKEGSSLRYTLTYGEGVEISTSLQRFRATAVRLRAFHLGCARMALHMKRYLRTGDPKWLKVDRPFGPLHGGARTAEGGYMWRGNKDDIDTDEWLDLVEDENLARLLHQVDRLMDGISGRPDEEELKKRAWKLLESVPPYHEDHVEVLRRRLRHFTCAEDFQDHASAVHWARKLVEAEPYDVVNWWSLFWAIEKHEGKAAAVEIVQEALRRHGPDFTLYYELASLLCALGQLEEAKDAMLLAFKEDIFSLKSALESECFAPIHDFIADQQESDWYKKEKEDLERRYPSEEFGL